MGEGFSGQPQPQLVVQLAGLLHGLEDGRVIGRVDDNADPGPVLGCGAQQGDATDIDHFDRRLRPERVKVAHHQPYRVDPILRQVGNVAGIAEVGQNAPVKPRMERFYSSPKHFGRARNRLDRRMR